MGKSAFPGGIHTYEGKSLSEDQAIERFFPESGEMCYPLSQHIGAPAVPCVKAGDKVLAGQIIAQISARTSSNVLSSVSGTVLTTEGVTPGSSAPCIIIENDGLYEYVEGLGTPRDFDSLTSEEIVDIVRQAGISGLGGAGFPTHIKLSPPDPMAIDYYIVNGAECEPYLTTDYRNMVEHGEMLIKGCEIALKLFPNAKCVIAVEDNKPKAIAHLEELIQGKEDILVRVLPTKYPQGGERSLIYAATGRRINSKTLPPQIGCAVNNVATVIAIANGVINSIPLLTKVVTVTGGAAARPCNVQVPLGTSYAALLEYAGGFFKEPAKIIDGGPMMGRIIESLDGPIVKTTSAILCMTDEEALLYEEESCMRCGRCADVCPEGLMPMLIDIPAQKENCQEFIKRYGMECVECGCCSYICPARRDLTARFVQMKIKARAFEQEGGENGK